MFLGNKKLKKYFDKKGEKKIKKMKNNFFKKPKENKPNFSLTKIDEDGDSSSEEENFDIPQNLSFNKNNENKKTAKPSPFNMIKNGNTKTNNNPFSKNNIDGSKNINPTKFANSNNEANNNSSPNLIVNQSSPNPILPNFNTEKSKQNNQPPTQIAKPQINKTTQNNLFNNTKNIKAPFKMQPTKKQFISKITPSKNLPITPQKSIPSQTNEPNQNKEAKSTPPNILNQPKLSQESNPPTLQNNLSTNVQNKSINQANSVAPTKSTSPSNLNQFSQEANASIATSSIPNKNNSLPPVKSMLFINSKSVPPNLPKPKIQKVPFLKVTPPKNFNNAQISPTQSKDSSINASQTNLQKNNNKNNNNNNMSDKEKNNINDFNNNNNNINEDPILQRASSSSPLDVSTQSSRPLLIDNLNSQKNPIFQVQVKKKYRKKKKKNRKIKNLKLFSQIPLPLEIRGLLWKPPF